jgi:hypothetical protein
MTLRRDIAARVPTIASRCMFRHLPMKSSRIALSPLAGILAGRGIFRQSSANLSL